MGAPANPYDSTAVSGFNASAPPDDGTRTSNNKVEWQKHVDKLAQPLKTAIEAIDTELSSAFGELIMTTDPGQETVVQAMRQFMPRAPDTRLQQKRTLDKAADLVSSEQFVVGSAMFS